MRRTSCADAAGTRASTDAFAIASVIVGSGASGCSSRSFWTTSGVGSAIFAALSADTPRETLPWRTVAAARFNVDWATSSTSLMSVLTPKLNSSSSSKR